MKIALGCDHGGCEIKNAIKQHFTELGHTVTDFGIEEGEAVDYPKIAIKLGKSVASGDNERGILVCGTGIGMSIAANKIKGIRAAAVSDHFSAKYTRLHNDANILCLGGRVIGVGTALELADIFIDTAFDGGERHVRRIAQITAIENNN